jgi:hypothetical protein
MKSIFRLIGFIMLVTATAVHAEQPAVFEADFVDIDNPQSKISLGIRHKEDKQSVSHYTENKSQKGAYSRTKYNVLICEEAPCEQTWSSSFTVASNGTEDSINVQWKQITFTGITPTGTIRRELSICVNKVCKKYEDPMPPKPIGNTPPIGTQQDDTIGNYRMTWSKASLIIERNK